MALRKTGKFPAATPAVLNQLVIWVAYPALVLVQIPALLGSLAWSWELAIPISMAWLLFGVAFLVFHLGVGAFPWGKSTAGALVLTAGLSNTSFVGFPLLEALLGPDAVRVGILVDQPGSFLALSTVGLLYATAYSPRGVKRPSARATAKKILLFPPFAALLLAIGWWLMGTPGAAVATTVMDKLAVTLVPLALTAVGFQLKLSPEVLRRKWKPLAAGLSFKLVLAPLLFTALYVGLLGSTTFSTKVTLLESAMAPMITGAIVAEDLGFDPELANLMLGLGIPLSLFTVWLWTHAWTF